MKELYNKPMLVVDEFKLVDVMTASPTTNIDGDEGGEAE
jgi:hypothetical protein